MQGVATERRQKTRLWFGMRICVCFVCFGGGGWLDANNYSMSRLPTAPSAQHLGLDLPGFCSWIYLCLLRYLIAGRPGSSEVTS